MLTRLNDSMSEIKTEQANINARLASIDSKVTAQEAITIAGSKRIEMRISLKSATRSLSLLRLRKLTL